MSILTIDKCLTADEAALVGALVDHMEFAGKAAGKDIPRGMDLYLDAALGAEFGRGDHLQVHDPSRVLYRIGMTATNAYCARSFGEQFDAISHNNQRWVLRLLDTIKLVFEDGSGAGVFFAVVSQAMRHAKPAAV